MELTNAMMKDVARLAEGRERRASGLFRVEGTRAVLDTLGRFELSALYATAAWLDEHPLPAGVKAVAVRAKDIERMTSASTPQGVVAVYRIPHYSDIDLKAEARRSLLLALDTIQDPGNLGTIVRTADWYGIHTIVASRETADVWQPKVVQSTMGAVARVRVVYVDSLADTLGSLGPEVDIFGTFLGGDDIYTAPLSATGVLVIGNEGRGISDAVASRVTRRLTIPSYPGGVPTSESLNAAVATAIAVSEFRRRLIPTPF